MANHLMAHGFTSPITDGRSEAPEQMLQTGSLTSVMGSARSLRTLVQKMVVLHVIRQH